MSKAALYIHIPFCLRKCLYCDFSSGVPESEAQMHAYTDALIAEMEACAQKAEGRVFDTVFFGGGTPTLLPFSDVQRLMDAIRRLFTPDADAEITMEANPATADKEKLSALRRLGINRLSIGVQSLVDEELTALGRLHTAGEAERFFLDARAAGFQNVNVDLMYGIPGQTVESLSRTLARVRAWAPEHISAYSLIVEEGTPFYRMRDTLALPDEDTEDALHRMICEELSRDGYARYEISNFAKKGSSCRHNLHYWRGDEYLGFGTAACSFWDGVRYSNSKDIERYLSAPTLSVCEKEALTENDLAYERIMLGLRLSEGLDTDAYEARFGIKLKERFASLIDRFVALGWMKEKGARLFLTEQGMRFSNTILVAFLEGF